MGGFNQPDASPCRLHSSSSSSRHPSPHRVPRIFCPSPLILCDFTSGGCHQAIFLVATEIAYSDSQWRRNASKLKSCSLGFWFDIFLCHATHHIQGRTWHKFASSENPRLQFGDQVRKWHTFVSSENPRLQLAANGGRKPDTPWDCFFSWWSYLICLLVPGALSFTTFAILPTHWLNRRWLPIYPKYPRMVLTLSTHKPPTSSQNWWRWEED